MILMQKKMPIHKSNLFQWDVERKSGFLILEKLAPPFQLDFNGIFGIESVDTKKVITCEWNHHSPQYEVYTISLSPANDHMKEWKIYIKHSN